LINVPLTHVAHEVTERACWCFTCLPVAQYLRTVEAIVDGHVL